MTRLLIFNLATDADDSALGFVVTWLAEFAKHVTAIDVITMRAGRLDLPPNVHVHSVGKEKGYSEFRRFIEFYRLLFHLLRQHRYDACFAHMMPLFAVMAAPFLRLKKIPIVLWYAHKSVTPMLRLATWLVDRVVTSVPEGFRVKTKKVRIVGQGIDVKMFAPQPDISDQLSPFTVVTVGRISRSKRLDLLIQALERFVHTHPDIRIQFQIIGGMLTPQDHEHYHQLQKQIMASRLQKYIHFEGSRPYQQIAPCYQNADCFISTSETGSIDKVVLEAMSCGVIPIITNHSLAEAFNEKLAALCLVSPDSEIIAKHMFRVFSLPYEERQSLRMQLREIVIRDHSLTALVEKILHECVTA